MLAVSVTLLLQHLWRGGLIAIHASVLGGQSTPFQTRPLVIFLHLTTDQANKRACLAKARGG
jgi:hypothetical protein